MSGSVSCNTVIIGGGQAGLSVGYHLKRRGLPFVILEARERVGDAWRHRWDSLRLFTPNRYNGLAGMPFPGRDWYCPTKDEMAAYLEAYAARFDLPVRTGMRVERLSRRGDRFLLEAGAERIEADNVVVAMATFQQPFVPSFAAELDSRIVQLHSREYRNLEQLAPGAVLIVGAGNSGAEIAIETARRQRTFMAGRDVGQIPFRLDGTASRLFLSRLMLRFVFHRMLTTTTPMGRRLRSKVLFVGGPLIRTRATDLAAANVQRVPRVTGARHGVPLLADGRRLEVANVIWCTGFTPGFSWIDLPVIDDMGQPRHARGIVTAQPGLYFVGLHFLHALSSTMIHGVGRDADYIARAIAERTARTRVPERITEARSTEPVM